MKDGGSSSSLTVFAAGRYCQDDGLPRINRKKTGNFSML